MIVQTFFNLLALCLSNGTLGNTTQYKCLCVKYERIMFLTEVNKTVIMWNIFAIGNNGFLFYCNLYLWWLYCIFSIHYFSLQCHMITEIILICWFDCSINISYFFSVEIIGTVFQDFWVNIKFTAFCNFLYIFGTLELCCFFIIIII